MVNAKTGDKVVVRFFDDLQYSEKTRQKKDNATVDDYNAHPTRFKLAAGPPRPQHEVKYSDGRLRYRCAR